MDNFPHKRKFLAYSTQQWTKRLFNVSSSIWIFATNNFQKANTLCKIMLLLLCWANVIEIKEHEQYIRDLELEYYYWHSNCMYNKVIFLLSLHFFRVQDVKRIFTGVHTHRTITFYLFHKKGSKRYGKVGYFWKFLCHEVIRDISFIKIIVSDLYYQDTELDLITLITIPKYILDSCFIYMLGEFFSWFTE